MTQIYYSQTLIKNKFALIQLISFILAGNIITRQSNAVTCCHCPGLEKVFDRKLASRELQKYRKKGPDKTTRLLVDAIQATGIKDLKLLDIGGGIGVIHNELLKVGLGHATEVEGSSAYLAAAKEEAERQGHADKISLLQGDFVDMAKQISATDIVTLDKVICCYPDMASMVRLSAERAGKLYAVIYPLESWWVKLGFRIQNLLFRIKKNPFRIYVHPTQAIENLICESGLKRKFSRKLFMWQLAVYER